MKVHGKKHWAFAAGHIPLASCGREPDFCSHDKISVLNTSDDTAHIEVTVFYEDRQPVGTYKFRIKPQRVRKIRFNDVIDPTAMPLDENYGCYVKSNVPVVVQFTKMDTGSADTALLGSMAFPVEADETENQM